MTEDEKKPHGIRGNIERNIACRMELVLKKINFIPGLDMGSHPRN